MSSKVTKPIIELFLPCTGTQEKYLETTPLHPSPYFFTADTLERVANAVGMSIQPPATNEREDRERINKQIMRGYRGPNQ